MATDLDSLIHKQVKTESGFVDGGYNRRRHTRKSANWPVAGYWSDKKPIKARTINISCSGILMQVPVMIPSGTRGMIHMKTYINGIHKNISAIVVVMHTSISQNLFNCGVQILKYVDKSDEEFLNRYANGKNPYGEVEDAITNLIHDATNISSEVISEDFTNGNDSPKDIANVEKTKKKPVELTKEILEKSLMAEEDLF